MNRSLKKLRKLHSNVSPSRRASKFKFTISYEYVHLSCLNNWKPNELQVLWFRGQRSKTSSKPRLSAGGKSNDNNTRDCIGTWKPPSQVELIVTLYRDLSGSMFKKKDYMFVLENISGSDRKKLGIFPCNMSEYVSEGSDVYDLEMEFKTVSKKVSKIKIGVRITCEFVKEGRSLDDDMMSNFSHMSEPDLRRLSDLADFSDEDEDLKLEDIKESLGEVHSDDDEVNPENDDVEEEEEIHKSSEELAKRSQHTWSQFIEEMKTLEIRNLAMVNNPISEKSDTLRSVDSDSSIEEFPSTINRGKRRVVSAIFTECDSEEKARSMEALPSGSTPDKKKDTHKTKPSAVDKESPQKEEREDGKARSDSDAKSQNGGKNFKFGFIKQIPGSLPTSARNKNKTTLPSDVTSMLNAKQNEIDELYHREKDHLERISALEEDNRSFMKRNYLLEQELTVAERDRDELQTEINELQLLVQDMRAKLKKTEASEKKVIKESKEILAKMNIRGWLCKKGIKGLTGRRWRRRWFATDDSGKLYYYKRNNNQTPRGFIDLDEIVSVQDVRSSCQDINNASFNILTSNRKYEMMAHDEDEKHKWINALDYLRHWRSHTLSIQTATDSPQLSSRGRSATRDTDFGNPFL